MDDHTAISKSVVGDHYGQRLYDKWLMRGEADLKQLPADAYFENLFAIFGSCGNRGCL